MEQVKNYKCPYCRGITEKDVTRTGKTCKYRRVCKVCGLSSNTKIGAVYQ